MDFVGLGFDPVDVYRKPKLWILLIVLFYLWKSFGYSMVIYLPRSLAPVLDSQFRIVPGLAASLRVSLESMNYPGCFLRRNSSNKLVLEAYGKNPDYKSDATFLLASGWADSAMIFL